MREMLRRREKSDNDAVSPHVLHIRSATGHGGGPERTILNAPRYLGPLGYTSTCVYLHHRNGDQFLRERAAAAGADFISVVDHGPLDVSLPRKIGSICRSTNATILHSHDYKTDVLGLMVRRLVPVKLVATVHGWGVQNWKTPLYHRLDKLSLRQFDAVICVSKDLYEECLRCGIHASRCHQIDNGVDTKIFQRTLPGNEAKRRLGVPRDCMLLGALGRLSPEKGFDLLIAAVDRLIGQGRDVSLWIAGEGPQRAKLREQIDRLGHGERIRLVGHLDDVTGLLGALDGYVLSSLREGLPMVVLEAMAMEVPVVATRTAGVPTLIRDGENGLLVDSGSVDELVTGITRLLDNPAEATQLAQAGRTTIEQSYSFEQRMKRVAEVYEECRGAE